MRSAILALPIMLLAGACGDSGTAPTAIPANAIVVEAGPVEGLLGGFRLNSGIRSRERMVIRDRAAWARLWERMNTGTGAQPPSVPPAVDFQRYMVIAATMGQRTTGGYEIIIESVHRAGDNLYVVVNERGHARCLVTQGETAPLDGVLVPRTGGRVIFLERTSVHICGP